MDASSPEALRRAARIELVRATPPAHQWPARRALRDDVRIATATQRSSPAESDGMRQLISDAYAAGLQQHEPATWMAGAKVGFMCGGLVGLAFGAAILTFAFRLGLQS